MSAHVASTVEVDIGPETKLPDAQYAILYSEDRIEEFKAAMNQSTNYTVLPNINDIRLLVSGFGDASTYKPYRASLETDTSLEIMMPATVFNLCGLPHNGNYGSSDLAAPKIGSRFLYTIAATYLLNKRSVLKSHFEEPLQFFKAAETKKSQQWRVLCSFVEALETELEENQEIDILAFGRAHVGPLATMINQALAKANTQIKANVADKIKRVYGHSNDC